jgi:hypothetical protein
MKQHEEMKEYYQSSESDFDVDLSSCTKSNRSDDITSIESQSSNDSFANLVQQHCMPDCRAAGMASLR